MKNILLPILLLLGLMGFSQTAKEKNDSVFRLVQQYVDAKNSTALYALTGQSFQKSISKEQFVGFSQNNLFPLGTIKTTHFEKITGSVSKYKVAFPTATMQFFIGLDTADKIKSFSVQPYQDETPKAGQALSNNPLKSKLDTAVEAAARPFIQQKLTHSLSVGILRNDSLYFYGYGELADGSGIIPDKNSLFEIGSITKTFTATLLALAVTEGKVQLDDPTSKYLPDLQQALQWKGTPVTLKTLSNHTSGIDRMPGNFNSLVTNPNDPYKDYTTDKLLQFFKTYKLSRKPGEKYEYSNLGVALLGIILERTYNKPYEQLVIEKIATPLYMSDTRQRLLKTDSIRFAKGYDEKGNYNGPWNFKAFAAAGCIRSTAADMLKYAKANMGTAPKPLQQAMELTHTVTFDDDKSKVGLGWHYIQPGKEEILWHNGGTGGFTSYLGINLKKKFAIVMLSNTADIGLENVGGKIIRSLEEE